MTETVPERQTVTIAGQQFTFAPMTPGQFQMLSRIRYGMSRAVEDASVDYISKTMGRLGTLIESLMTPEEADALEQLLLGGKTDYNEILAEFFKAQNPQVESAPAKVASPKRARRG